MSGRVASQPIEPKQILTTEDVAALLSVQPIEIKRLYKVGRLVGAKIGGQLRFRPAAVDQFMAEEEARCRSSSEPHGSTPGQTERDGSSSGTTAAAIGRDDAQQALRIIASRKKDSRRSSSNKPAGKVVDLQSRPRSGT